MRKQWLLLAPALAVTVYPADVMAAKVEKMSVKDISVVAGNFTLGNKVTAEQV